MALRIFSVTGEALNYGGRRMPTIMRVAWLPVVLLLVLNMTTVYATLSVIAGEVITFTEISTFTRAQQLAVQYASQGFEKAPNAMRFIMVANLALQTLLIATFMAPLIRYSGLGEKPRPGILRLAFGADQIRYIISAAISFLFVAILIFAPIMAATFYVGKYIVEALSQTMASFPDPDSLHTIELTTAGADLAARSASWIYEFGVPMAAVVPLAVLLWLLIFFHFHPRNRPAVTRRNPIFRGFVTLVVTAGVLAGGYWLLRERALTIFQHVSVIGGEAGNIFDNTPLNTKLIFGVVAYFLAGYLNLRLFSYPGVAVCRKSLMLGETLRVSRGWNIIRLQIILFFAGAILISVLFVINNYAMGWLLLALNSLYQAVASYTRLLGSGITADWVQPLFVWVWNGVKILANIFWAFFSYGVVAGLYGRLYRESERDESVGRAQANGPEVWRRNDPETEGV